MIQKKVSNKVLTSFSETFACFNLILFEFTPKYKRLLEDNDVFNIFFCFMMHCPWISTQKLTDNYLNKTHAD